MCLTLHIWFLRGKKNHIDVSKRVYKIWHIWHYGVIERLKILLTLKKSDDELKSNMRMTHVTWNFPDYITADGREKLWSYIIQFNHDLKCI